MKILVGYYTEKEMEVDDKFLPLQIEDDYESATECAMLLSELVEQVDKSLEYPSSLCGIIDANGDVIYEQ